MIRRVLPALAPFVLPGLGCILIAAAAFAVALWTGLLVSGIACWVMDWNIEAERRNR